MMQNQLRQAEKLSSLGEIISGVAHELNNPISCITGYTDLLLRYSELGEAVTDKIEIIRDEAVRTSKIVRNLLSFARKNPIERKQCDIAEIVQSVLDFRSYEIRMSKIVVEEHIDEGMIPANADPDQLRQVFLNSVNNAIHAADRVAETVRSAAPPGELPPIAVLVVDDEPNSARLMSSALSNLGCRTTVVLGGAEAINHMQDRNFDEIICDYRMPDIDGITVFRWIKEHMPVLLTKFILTTGDILSQKSVDELSLESIPILRKPYELDELHRLFHERHVLRASVG